MKFNFGKEKKDLAEIEQLKADLIHANLRIRELRDKLSSISCHSGYIAPTIDPIRELLAENYRPDMRAFVLDERDAFVHHLYPPEKTAVKFLLSVDDAKAVKGLLRVQGAMEGIETVIVKQDTNQMKKFKMREATEPPKPPKTDMTRRY